jgi:RimJ/RimL family protein N-acetyltransferase
MDSSLDHLRQWMPWAMHEPSELWVIEERIARFQRDFLSGEDRTYGIFNLEETEILGGIGLHPTVYPGTLELGYWLRADQTGQGLATEAAAALTQAAFAQLGAQRIEIRCDPRNLRSARVPERLGFRMEKVLIADTLTPAGELRDTMVWAATAEEFSCVRANAMA